jgi:DNA-binding NarL/FixJ family response regulator
MTSVLIVDDVPADRELLATILRHAGYEILEADSGEQALKLAWAHKPALIIADILTATIDGYELVRELRGDQATAEIPVVFSTVTCVIEEARRLAAACGVSHIILKPADPETVLAIIEEAIALPQADPVLPLPSEEFHRQHLRIVNAKLLQEVEELRETVILAGALQQVDGFAPRPVTPNLPDVESLLSRRELQVLGMIVDGATNYEIAERLFIATSTVQSHVKRILHKLGVKNRTEAAVRYVRR